MKKIIGIQNTRKELLRKAVREIIVTRRSMETIAKLPNALEARDASAVALFKKAKFYNLDYALITRKF